MIEDKIPKKIIAGGYLLGISMAIAICTYSFWSYFGSFTVFGREIKTFYFGIALSFVGYTVVINILANFLYKKSKVSNKTLLAFLILSEIAVLASVSGLLDEVIFDPTKLGVNEYISFVIMCIISFYKILRNDKRG